MSTLSERGNKDVDALEKYDVATFARPKDGWHFSDERWQECIASLLVLHRQG